jgi:hypothetical protein
MKDRKDILLRAAYDLLKRADNSHYSEHATEIIVCYDDVNCDGYCLMNDIAYVLNLEDDTDPLPLKSEDDD